MFAFLSNSTTTTTNCFRCSLSTVMYVSARARRENLTYHHLRLDLEIEETSVGETDERHTPLLAAQSQEEVEQSEQVQNPPMVDNIILLDEKEVPAEIPEASEVV